MQTSLCIGLLLNQVFPPKMAVVGKNDIEIQNTQLSGHIFSTGANNTEAVSLRKIVDGKVINNVSLKSRLNGQQSHKHNNICAPQPPLNHLICIDYQLCE